MLVCLPRRRLDTDAGGDTPNHHLRHAQLFQVLLEASVGEAPQLLLVTCARSAAGSAPGRDRSSEAGKSRVPAIVSSVQARPGNIEQDYR